MGSLPVQCRDCAKYEDYDYSILDGRCHECAVEHIAFLEQGLAEAKRAALSDTNAAVLRTIADEQNSNVFASELRRIAKDPSSE